MYDKIPLDTMQNSIILVKKGGVMKKGLLWILDICIAVAFVLLMFIVIKPQYELAKINANRSKLQSSMFTVKAGMERYIAFHQGVKPTDLTEIYENIAAIEIPINPYTNKEISIDDILVFKYDVPRDFEDTSPEGVNGKQSGEPGQIGIGFFTPLGTDSIPTKYGIIGFDENGNPLIIIEGKKERVVVLSG